MGVSLWFFTKGGIDISENIKIVNYMTPYISNTSYVTLHTSGGNGFSLLVEIAC